MRDLAAEGRRKWRARRGTRLWQGPPHITRQGHSCSGELASASRFEYLQQRKNTDLGKNQLDSLSGEELNPWKKSEIHGSMSWIRELLHQAVLQVLHGGGSMSGCFGCPISHQFSMVLIGLRRARQLKKLIIAFSIFFALLDLEAFTHLLATRRQ